MHKLLISALFTWIFLTFSANAQIGLPAALPTQTFPQTGGGGFSGQGDKQSASHWWGTWPYSAATAGTKAVNVCPTGTTTGCADINSDTTNGLNLTQLAAVPCNDSTNKCDCAIGYDVPASGGAANWTQSTVANRPLLVVSSSVGSKPACRCATSACKLTSAALGTQPYAFALTAAVVTNGGNGPSFMFDGSAIGIQEAGSAFWQCSNRTILSIAAADGSPHSSVCTFRASGSGLVFSVLPTTGTSPQTGGTTTDAGFSFTGFGLNASGTTIDIVGGGIFPLDLTATQQADLIAPVRSFYGF